MSSIDVRATFDYLRDPPADNPSEVLFYYTERKALSSVRLVSVEAPVFDGRDSTKSFSLDNQGLSLVNHHSSINDFSIMSEPHDIYENEMEELIKQVTGAEFAKTFNVNLRFTDRPDNFLRTGDDQPARFPHADYTDESAESLISMFKPSSESYSRSAIYNVWRVFSSPPQDFPLAVCDYTTVDTSDEETVLARIDLDPENVHESSTVLYRYNPRHKWIYFSDMTIDEVIIFKGFDSDRLRPQRVPHSSFLNPAAKGEISPRASVEARVVAFYT